MRRFWKEAAVVGRPDGWGIALDGKPLRTPARKPLVAPAEALAEAIAGEWGGSGETLDPRSMPLTGLANAAIDQVAPDPQGFAGLLAGYGDSDLVCYRAEGPPRLVARQQDCWDRLLGWARARFDIDFRTTSGVVHVAQPEATAKRLAHAVSTLDPFRLAGLSPLVTIGGSLVAALAVLEGAIEAGDAWDMVTIDERWQLEQWGSDSQAEAALEDKRRDFMVAAEFLKLLDA